MKTPAPRLKKKPAAETSAQPDATKAIQRASGLARYLSDIANTGGASAARNADSSPAATTTLKIDQIGTDVADGERVLNPRSSESSAYHEDLATLVESIRELGVLQPLLVQCRPDGSYRLLAGHRRLKAAMLAGLSEVPVVLYEVSDLDAMTIAMVENVERVNLSFLEQSWSVERLYSTLREEVENASQADLATRINRSATWVSHRLKTARQLPYELLASTESLDPPAGTRNADGGAGEDCPREVTCGRCEEVAGYPGADGRAERAGDPGRAYARRRQTGCVVPQCAKRVPP